MSKILKISILLIPIFLFFLKDSAFAQTRSEIVEASLKLSLCGDKEVEGQEDCEKGVKITENCMDFGYQKGQLRCDNSCSFDFQSCNYIKDPSEEDEDENESEETEEIEQETAEEEKNEERKYKEEKVKTKYIPLLLRTFDYNRDEIIDLKELTIMLTDWVDNWRIFRQVEEEQKEEVNGECDVNFDGMCNLIDFSIILYYVDND